MKYRAYSSCRDPAKINQNTSLLVVLVTYGLVHQLLNAPCVPTGTIGDMQGHNVVVAKFQARVRVRLEILLVALLEHAPPAVILLRTAANLPTRLQVALTVLCAGKFFQDKQASQALNANDRAFEDLSNGQLEAFRT